VTFRLVSERLVVRKFQHGDAAAFAAYRSDPAVAQAEIGFSLATPFQGRGYAAEAVRLMIRHLFTERGLHRISAECDARNAASARLLERVGFQREGDNTWIKGEWTDDLLFGLLARDYAVASATDG
jgi:RimJ/RimL family protein N-acetyltransferase